MGVWADPEPVHASAHWTRRDALLLLGLVVASTVPRVVLRTRGMFSVDSALLALGVRSYDFASYHPHPPYYPLTIAAAKMLVWLEPFAALTWLSLASSTILVACVYAVTRALAGRLAGAWAGAITALSPLALGNAVVPLSYASEGAASALVAALALNARRRPHLPGWILLGAAASLAVGLRPSAALTAAPLILWAVGPHWRAFLWTTAAGAVATASWVAGAILAGGTWSLFRYGLDYQSRVFILSNPVWEGGGEAVRNNVAWLLHHLRVEVPLLVTIGLLAALTALAPRQAPRHHRGFLLVWIAPSLLFYGLVYAGWPIFPSGYLMGLAPAFFVAAAVGLRRLLRIARDPLLDAPLRHAATVAVAVLAVAPLAWAGAWDDELALRDRATVWERSWDGFEATFPANRTAVVAAYAGPWMVLEHPGHLTWIVEAVVAGNGSVHLQVEQWRDGRADKSFFDNARDGRDDPLHPIPSWVERIVVVQNHPMEGDVPPLLRPEPSQRVTLPGGAVAAVYTPADLGRHIEEAMLGWGQVAGGGGHELVWPPS